MTDHAFPVASTALRFVDLVELTEFVPLFILSSKGNL